MLLSKASKTTTSLTQMRLATFASQFTKLERTLDKFDPSEYELARTDQAKLVAQPWSQRPFDHS